MKELEVSRDRYAERRHKEVSPEQERRAWVPGKRRMGLAQSSYLIQLHLQTCIECRRWSGQSEEPSGGYQSSVT
jgi:hypothetical protein